MMRSGKGDLFKVLVYNLVDAILCVRLAKTIPCLRDLVYKCLASYNIDCLSHGRLENFQVFVQSIHSVSFAKSEAGPTHGRRGWGRTRQKL